MGYGIGRIALYCRYSRHRLGSALSNQEAGGPKQREQQPRFKDRLMLPGYELSVHNAQSSENYFRNAIRFHGRRHFLLR